MDIFDRGVPIRGVFVRHATNKARPDGTLERFRMLDAEQLDNGVLIKVAGDFTDFDPERPMVVDLINRKVVLEEFEYRVMPVTSDAQSVRDAIETSRARGPRPSDRDLPPGFVPDHLVIGTDVLMRDRNGGPYTIFFAKNGPGTKIEKIVARVPDRNPLRGMRMALKPSKDQNGNPQHVGVFMG